MKSEDWDKIHELKEEYYLLHSKLVLDQLKKCDNEEQQMYLMEQMNECNSVYGIKKNIE